jgi:hypothetical protein
MGYDLLDHAVYLNDHEKYGTEPWEKFLYCPLCGEKLP